MRWSIVAVLAVALSGPIALAQADQSGILVYKADFFAEARPNTAYDMIQRLPGFAFDDGKAARGFAGTAGNVLINGQRPTAKTDDLQSILQRIPASEVERVELIRGGAQGVDMHGQTVVANVVLKKHDSTKIVADITNDIWPNGHMMPSASIQYTGHVGESTYEASLSQIGNYDDAMGSGFYDVIDASSGATTHYDTHYRASGVGWGATGAASVPLFGGQFKANLIYQDSPFGAVFFYDLPTDGFGLTDNSGSKNGEAGLHWIGPLGGIELETLVLQRLGRATAFQQVNAPGDNELFKQRNRTAESIARAIVRYRPKADLTIEAGGEGVYNLLDGSTSYSVNGAAIPLPSANAHVDEKRAEAFAQAMWSFAPKWSLEAGARFEYSVISENSDTGLTREFFYPKPRVLLTWTPREDTQVRLRYERVLGQLDFTNFVASSDLQSTGVSGGNPNLAPDRHSQYELSFEQHFWDRGAAVVTLLHEDISGVLDYIPVTGSSGIFDAPGNIGNGHKDQISVELTLPLDRVGLTNGLFKSSTTWRFSGVRDPATGTERAISGVRPRRFVFTLTQDIESLKSTWGVLFSTGWDEQYFRPLQFRHRKIIPPNIELSWSYKPTSQWMFSAALKNLGRFGYDDVNYAYGGLRGSAPPVQTTEFKVKSQIRLHLEIRRTF